MGRYVYEGSQYVWKYIFAGQNSEQGLIPQEIGVGHMVYNKRNSHDTLVIYCSKNAVNKLRNWVRHEHPEVPDKYSKEDAWNTIQDFFPYMVWAYAAYIEQQLPRRRGERLRFWGEY